MVAMGLAQDPRLRAVRWRDLLALSKGEIAWELALSAPWLAVGLLGFHAEWYVAALLSSFFFFLTGLRQVHNACHYMLGISRWLCDVGLLLLSVLMLSAMHAVQVTHLHHHRHCLDEDDVEAATAKLPAWRALLLGPLHPVRLHYWGFCLCNRSKRLWIAGEVAAITVTLLLVFAVLDIWALKCLAVTMLVGECFTGFFAVWSVHHDCSRSEIARTQRGWLKNFVSYNMLFHLEHHLFPNVPTCHLPKLARRIDRAAPQLRTKNVY
ncbi:MAG: fatty acid desaturase [Planctomycetota bacterium]|nr:MAG: fatty acid desaturase [Planctomycetota bacterium]